MAREKYIVILEKSNLGYSAYCPDLLGCTSAGDNMEQTINNMREAMELYIDVTLEDGIELSEPSSLEALEQGDLELQKDDVIVYISVNLPEHA